MADRLEWDRTTDEVEDGMAVRPARRGRLLAVLLALVVLVAAVGCGSSDGGDEATGVGSDGDGQADGPTPQSGGGVKIAVPLGEAEYVLRLALEPLTAFDADGNVVPYLAESVDANETFDRWTITVRPGITFHNGEPLDAEAVKANLETYALSDLYATDPFAPIQAVNVVDERTVEVEMSAPWSTFPAALTAEQSDGTGLIAAPASLAEAGSLFLANPAATALYGTGPFVLEPAESGAGFVDVNGWVGRKNPDYWQEGLPYLDTIEYVSIADRSSRLEAVDAGDVDLAILSNPAEDAGSNQVYVQEGDVEVLAVALNTRRAPLDDPTVREALVLATDVEALADAAGVDASMLASGPFGPGSSWADPDASPSAYDPARATELITAYEAANGPIAIRLGAQGLEIEDVAVQQLLAEQWTAAGIDVEISVVDPFTQTANLLVTADFDAVMGALFGNPDPDLNYFWWHSSALKTEEKRVGYNYVGLEDAALDEALDLARTSQDTEFRRDQLVTAQQRIADAMPYVWLWGVRWGVEYNERVHGVDAAPLPDGGTRWPMVGSILNVEGLWIDRGASE